MSTVIYGLKRLGASNLLALLGVLTVAIAVAELAGGWWALLLIGVVLIVMAYVAYVGEQAAAGSAAVPPVSRSSA